MPDDRLPSRVALGRITSTAVPDLAAKLADLHGFDSVIVLGWRGWKAHSYPNLRTIRPNIDDGPRARGRASLHGIVPSSTSALVVDVSENLAASLRTASDLGSLIDESPLVLLRVADHLSDVVLNSLGQRGKPATFVGRTRLDDGGTGTVVIIDRAVAEWPNTEPPEGFRVLAIITTFNEEDILASTIEALVQDGVEIRIVDNWSTDSTYAIASHYAERGLLTLERFPEQPVATFNHAQLLRRVEEIADQAGASWVIHHDTDERRRSPWSGAALRRALWTVDQSGFNAINHTVVTFRPVDDGWRPGVDPEDYFRFFELEPRPDLLLQVRAWRATSNVDLVTTGGHEARFAGRRVFPYHFLLKHYPLRSQEQAERKVFRERRARWNKDERAKGWHHHYDAFQVGQSFRWSPSDLTEFLDARTQSELIVPFLGGAEVGQPWAANARITAAENELMAEEALALQRRLERTFGVKTATIAINLIRRVAWLARPIRRAIARHRWRQLAKEQRSRTIVS